MKKVLLVAALSEVATGAGLLIVPTVVGRLLLSAEFSGVSIVIARVTGIALIGLGTACWPGRMNPLRGILIYNILTTLYLAWLLIEGEWVGVLLWPVALLHVVMSILLGRVWFTDRKQSE